MRQRFGCEVIWRFEHLSIPYCMTQSSWRAACDALLSTLSEFHRSQPAEPGTPEHELRRHLGNSVPRNLFPALLSSLIGAALIERRHNTICMRGHLPEMSPTDTLFWQRVQILLGEQGLRPPPLHDLCLALGEDPKDLRGKLARLTRQ